MVFVNDILADLLLARCKHGPPWDFSHEESLGFLVNALRMPTPLKEPSFSCGDLQPLLQFLRSEGRLAGPDSLNDFRYAWIRMIGTFSFNESLKNDEPGSSFSQPHCRFLSCSETPKRGETLSAIRKTQALLLVGAATHMVPRADALLRPRPVDHHIECALENLLHEDWDSATLDIITAIEYPVIYPTSFMSSGAVVETVFRVIHRGTYSHWLFGDSSVVLGLPLYVERLKVPPSVG